jgi:D-ribose pyranose/furanose isomerase RbsD
MKKAAYSFVLLALLSTFPGSTLIAQTSDATWQSKLKQELPLLGHRNWILIVDSAYPLQISPGMETIETNMDQIEVVRDVLETLDHSAHVAPVAYLDAELSFVPEDAAPGVSAYRESLKQVLKNRETRRLLHEQIINKVADAGKTFHILVFKTNMTIPYTSVFLQLGCKYWPDKPEQQLRKAMSSNTRPQE